MLLQRPLLLLSSVFLLVVFVVPPSSHGLTTGATASGRGPSSCQRQHQHRQRMAIIPTPIPIPTSTTTSASSSYFSYSASTTALRFGKNSDRAHIERSLEAMMDNDWREFRAKLVALEKRDASAATGDEKLLKKDGKLAKQPPQQGGQQQHIGDLFAGAISSIFSKATSSSPGNNNDSINSKAATANEDIFEGNSVGRYSASAAATSRPPSSFLEEDDCDMVDDGDYRSNNCEDPFVSEQELPIHLRTPSTTALFDKRRWAHAIPHVEPGCVLIANEKLGGVFHQTIVLIVQHSEKVGSTGIVINRPLPGNLLKIASEQESRLDLSLKLAFPTASVTYGGPVATEEFCILHGFGHIEGSHKLCSGVYIGGDEELMNQVRINRFHAKNALFCKGHAAWVSGQLSREISKGVWYTAAVSQELILRYVNNNSNTHHHHESQPQPQPHLWNNDPDTKHKNDDDNCKGSSREPDLWAEILTCMGGSYAQIAQSFSGQGDRRVMP